MRTGKKQLTLAASALAMAIALTGCGGGGGTALKDAGSGSGVYTGAASFTATWTAQNSAIRAAITAAQGALDMLSLTSTDMDLAAAQEAVDEIATEIAAGTYLSASQKAEYEAMQTALMATLAAYNAGVMEVERLEGELTMAQAEVTRLTGALNDANGDNDELQNQLTAAQDKVTMLETDLGMANDKVTMLEGDLGTANDKITGLEGDLGTANDKITGLETDLGTANDKITGLEGDLDTANDKITGLEGDLAVANGKIETLERQIERQDGDLKALNEQLSDEKLKVQGLERDLQSEKDMVAQLQTDLQSEKDMVAQLQTDLQSEKDTVAQLQTDLQSEKDTVAQLQTDLQSEKDTVAQLQTDLQSEKDTVADLQGQLDEKDEEIARLKGQLDEAKREPQRVAVRKAITELEMALAKVDTGANNRKGDGGIEDADKALEAARQAVTNAGYLPEEETAELTGEVDTIAGALTTAKMDRTMSLVAATKEDAIMAEAAQTTDAGLGGSGKTDVDGTTTGNDASDDPYMLEISRGSSGPAMVKITDPDKKGDDDPKFMKASDVNAMTSMHTRKMKADNDGNMVEEVVVVSTDIKAPTATKFGDIYSLTVNTDTNTATSEAHDISTGALASTDMAQAAVLGRVMSTSFAAASEGSTVVHSYMPAADDGDLTTPGDQPRAAAMVSGTYDGAMGTYICNTGNGGADCSVTVNDEGKITAMTDGWVFTPASGAMVYVKDADHLHYGFWLKKTTDKDGVLTYDEVETFAESSSAAPSDVSAVRGTATYEGGATGVYVHIENKSDGTRKKATSGHFTADAMLTAYFAQTQTGDDGGAGQIAPNMVQTLTGTIDNFMLSGGEAQNWMVELQSDGDANTTGNQPGVQGTNEHMGTAKGGGGDGSFSATFHGPVVDDNNDPIAPHSVIGEFNAGFANGSVAGAFGASKMMDE